jgi:hypothetical protein
VLELVNATEFESMARLVLSPARYQTISGGHRRSFDKMTFRQRLMVYATDLDLTTELFGYEMFAPIIVGPVANQGDLHADGELGTARGAAAAKATMVATSESAPAVSRSGRRCTPRPAGRVMTPRGRSRPGARRCASRLACLPTAHPSPPTGTRSNS